MSDSESTNIIYKLKSRLFNNLTRPESDSSESGSFNDVTTLTEQKIAVTVNISPNKLMNKKVWKTYSHDKQRLILAKLEAHFRRVTPSVRLVRIEYEICPTVKNIHFHALYECPLNYESTIECYWMRISNTDKKTITPWRHLDIQNIYDEKGWLHYISKDIRKT
jgi:hypothetical protein